MVSPSATLLTHLSPWVRVCGCAIQCECAVEYCMSSRMGVWESLSEAEKTVSHLFALIIGCLWQGCPFLSNFCTQNPHHLDYWIMINRTKKTKKTETTSGICLLQEMVSDPVSCELPAKVGVDSRGDSGCGCMGEEGDCREWKLEKQDKTKRQGLLSSPYHLSTAAFSKSVCLSLPCRCEKNHCVLCIRGLWMIQVQKSTDKVWFFFLSWTPLGWWCKTQKLV